MEKELLAEVLNSCDNDLTEAARIMGMTKKAIEKKVEKYSL